MANARFSPSISCRRDRLASLKAVNWNRSILNSSHTLDSDPYFHSSETGKPFTDCVSCGLSLSDDPNLPFLVAKSYRSDECIFEYAICEDCRANMAREFSDESQRALATFFTNRVKFEERSELLSFGDLIEPWIETCAACKTPRNKAQTYSLGGILIGDSIIYDPYPLCLCGDCEEEIQSLLSQKTLGIWDDFVQANFDSPPGQHLDLPSKRRPVLL